MYYGVVNRGLCHIEVIIWNFYCYLLFGYLVVLFVVPDLKTVFLIGLTQFIAVAIFLCDIL